MANNYKAQKEGFVKFLSLVQSKGLKDNNIQARIAYSLKNEAKAKVGDLKELTQEIIGKFPKLKGDLVKIFNVEPAPVENSIKKPIKKKKEAPKTVEQKVVPIENKSAKEVVLADKFFEELSSGLGDLKVNFAIKNTEDVKKAIEDDEQLVFAMYWSKRHLKQFAYDTLGVASKKFTEFENDVDLCMPIHVTEAGTAIYAVSVYSGVMYVIKDKELAIEEGMRFTNGIEYNIYNVLPEKSEKAPETKPKKLDEPEEVVVEEEEEVVEEVKPEPKKKVPAKTTKSKIGKKNSKYCKIEHKSTAYALHGVLTPKKMRVRGLL